MEVLSLPLEKLINLNQRQYFKMKRIVFLIGIFSVCSLNIFAQDVSLEEVLRNSTNQNVIQADKQVEVEKIKLKIQQSKRVPNIFGEANLQRNLIVPTTPVPAIAFNPNAADGEIMPLRFATNWTAKAGLQLSFDIFNPETEGNIREAKLRQQKALIDQKETKRTADNEIRNLYAQVVLAQNQYVVAKELLDNYLVTLEIMKLRYESGRISEIEMNNTLKKVYELEQLEKEAQMVLLNKKIALLPYYNVDFNANFSTPIEEVLSGTKATYSKSNTESLEIDRALNELKIKNINMLAAPKLTLNGYLGSQFYNNQFRLFDTDYWFGTSYLNVALRLPITEAYERSLQKKQLKYENTILESKLLNSNSNDNIVELQRRNDIQILEDKVKNQERIVKLSDSNKAILKAQVEEGTVLVTEYNKELESYLDQMKKYWQAQYDLLQKTLN